MKQRTRNALIGCLFILPWLAGYLIFTLRPLIQALYLSFHEVRVTPTGIKTTPIGWANYRYAFLTDIQFGEKLIVYLGEIALNVPIIIVFSLIIALLLDTKVRGRGLFRTIFFLPVIILSGPVIAELIEMGATAIPNIEQYTLFTLFRGDLAPFLAAPITYLFDQIVLVLWFSGVQILVFLAGLQKIDRAIMEAARVDGASAWEAFWKITLPAVRPMIIVNLVYTLVTVSTFPLNEIINLMRQNMFNPFTGYGYSTALAWLYFLIISVILLLTAGVMAWRQE